MQLRSYQQRAIDDLRNAYRFGYRAPLLCLPTGGGKTIIFTAIAQASAARGRRVLILVHRRELIHQTSSKLAWVGLEHGIIAAHVRDIEGDEKMIAVLGRSIEEASTELLRRFVASGLIPRHIKNKG